MSTKERIQLVAIIGLFIFLGMVANNIFVLLTPIPDSPEMARAKAEAFLKETEADLQHRWLWETYAVAASVLGVILIVCGVIFWGAFLVLRSIVARSTPLHGQLCLPLPQQNPYDGMERGEIIHGHPQRL